MVIRQYYLSRSWEEVVYKNIRETIYCDHVPIGNGFDWKEKSKKYINKYSDGIFSDVMHVIDAFFDIKMSTELTEQ